MDHSLVDKSSLPREAIALQQGISPQRQLLLPQLAVLQSHNRSTMYKFYSGVASAPHNYFLHLMFHCTRFSVSIFTSLLIFASGEGEGGGVGCGIGIGPGIGAGIGRGGGGAPRNGCSWSATSTRRRGSPRCCQCPCPKHCQND